MAATRLDTAKLVDQLGAFLEVERAAVQLYSEAVKQVQDPELQTALQEFLVQTRKHVEALERLVRDFGGDPDKVTPSAQIVREQSHGLLDYMRRNIVEAIIGRPPINPIGILADLLLIELKGQSDWQLLRLIGEEFGEEHILQAVREIEPEEDRHVLYLRQKLVTLVRQELMAGS